MAVCHILQTEVYPSQTVDDNLTLSQAPTAADLEEDLNYIRSVLKAVHGGSTWYDVNSGLSTIGSDFHVEHYTTADNPSRAGQHKDIHADSVSAPYAVLDDYVQFANDSTPYRFVYETVGPFDEAGGTRIRFSGADATGGTKSGISFVPDNSTEFYSGIRARAYNYEFYTSSFDQSGGFSIISHSQSGEIVSISSEFHPTSLRVWLSNNLVAFNVLNGSGTIEGGSFAFNTNKHRWDTKSLYLWSQNAPTLVSLTNALTIGPIGGSTGGLKFGNTEILGVKSGNQHASIKMNSLGVEPVTVWEGVTAQNENPITVGQEGYQVWHRGNQGPGSELDADTVDGMHAAQFANIIEASVVFADGWTGTGSLSPLISLDFSHLPDDQDRTYVTTVPFILSVQPYCAGIPDENNYPCRGTAFEGAYTLTGTIDIAYKKNGTNSQIRHANIIVDNGPDLLLKGSITTFILTPDYLRLYFDLSNNIAYFGVWGVNMQVRGLFFISPKMGQPYTTQAAIISEYTQGLDVSAATPDVMSSGFAPKLTTERHPYRLARIDYNSSIIPYIPSAMYSRFVFAYSIPDNHKNEMHITTAASLDGWKFSSNEVVHILASDITDKFIHSDGYNTFYAYITDGTHTSVHRAKIESLIGAAGNAGTSIPSKVTDYYGYSTDSSAPAQIIARELISLKEPFDESTYIGYIHDGNDKKLVVSQEVLSNTKVKRNIAEYTYVSTSDPIQPSRISVAHNRMTDIYNKNTLNGYSVSTAVTAVRHYSSTSTDWSIVEMYYKPQFDVSVDAYLITTSSTTDMLAAAKIGNSVLLVYNDGTSGSSGKKLAFFLYANGLSNPQTTSFEIDLSAVYSLPPIMQVYDVVTDKAYFIVPIKNYIGYDVRTDVLVIDAETGSVYQYTSENDLYNYGSYYSHESFITGTFLYQSPGANVMEEAAGYQFIGIMPAFLTKTLLRTQPLVVNNVVGFNFTITSPSSVTIPTIYVVVSSVTTSSEEFTLDSTSSNSQAYLHASPSYTVVPH